MKARAVAILWIFVALSFGACASSQSDVVAALSPHDHDERGTRLTVTEGMASYYGRKFAGRPTASGEIFDPRKLTAAHRSAPFGTCLRVQNLTNGKAVEVKVNDRGPFAKQRIIDLSRAAAEEIDMIDSGVARVRLAYCS